MNGASPPSPVFNNKKQYTWKDVEKHNSLADCWIVVQGKVYDVSTWAPNHPGGKILITGAGRDSTAFMHSYHPRYVMELLDQFYVGDLEDYDNYYTFNSKFYSTMKSRVEKHLKENKLTRDSTQMYLTTLGVAVLWSLGYYFGFMKGYILATIFFGIMHSQIGINIMHDGNHGAYSSSPTINNIAAFMLDMMGGSSIVWLHQHNIGHHPNANNSDIPDAFDPDANSGFPYIRLNPSQPHKPYMRFQHIYIWILICFLNFKWFVNDVRSILKQRYAVIDFFHIADRDVQRLLLTKGFFFIYGIFVPLYSLGVTTGLMHFLLFMVVTGYSFVLMFSVNHLTEETSFPDAATPAESRDWATLQAMTSSNFANDSTFWTIVSGGLNFQIEHHLFPGINHTHLPKISPIVKQTCKEFGVPYYSVPTFSGAVYSYYKHVKNMGVRPKAA